MIFLSAGHHPYRKGASFEGFYEYDEAMNWVSILANLLGSRSIVVPTGLLKDKVAFINGHEEARLALEVHFNSARSSNGVRVGRGSETLFYPGSIIGKSIAKEVQERLGSIFTPDRGAKEGWYQMNKSNGPDYFLSRIKCPAIIVEPEFIHRKKDIISKRKEGCVAIASAVLDIFEDKDYGR